MSVVTHWSAVAASAYITRKYHAAAGACFNTGIVSPSYALHDSIICHQAAATVAVSERAQQESSKIDTVWYSHQLITGLFAIIDKNATSHSRANEVYCLPAGRTVLYKFNS